MKKVYIFWIFILSVFSVEGQQLLEVLDAPYYSVRSVSTGDYFRKSCPVGFTGTRHFYRSPVFTQSAVSAISQAHADQLAYDAAYALALNDVNTHGQAYANQHGICTRIRYTSTKTCTQSVNFRRNDCPPGYTGSVVTYTVTRTASYTSDISQADADAEAYFQACSQAMGDAMANGQAYANAMGTCDPSNGGGTPPVTYTSTKSCTKSGTFTRNNCSGGLIGTPVTYTQTRVATVTSTVSQAEADAQALAQACADAQSAVDQGGQAYANQHGICYHSHPSAGWEWIPAGRRIFVGGLTGGPCVFEPTPVGPPVQTIPYPGIWLLRPRKVLVQGELVYEACNCEEGDGNERPNEPPIWPIHCP